MSTLNIGITLGSTRKGRVSPQVGEWVKGIADGRVARMQITKSSILLNMISFLRNDRRIRTRYCYVG